MPKKPYLLDCQGDPRATDEYLLEYQKAILLALNKEGILNQSQLNECITRLEQNYRKNKRQKL